MTRFVSLSLVLFCCAALLMAAGDAPAPKVELPDLVTKAREARDREIERANTRYRNVLEREKEQATRRGTLDVALAIQAEIEQVGKPAGENAPLRLAGTRWSLKTHSNVWMEFLDEGRIRTFSPTDGGVWRDNGDGTATALYAAGLGSEIQVFKFSHDGDQAASTKAGSATPREWERVK